MNDNISREFVTRLKKIYNGLSAEINVEKTFDEVIETNDSRLTFLNDIFEKYNNNQLSGRIETMVRENIEYIKQFINGELKEQNMKVPITLTEDKFNSTYLPTDEEIKTLFKLMEINNKTLNNLFVDNKISIKLPSDSIHKNITEDIYMDKGKIPHLLGLTSGKSSLKEIYEEKDKEKNPELYDENGIPKRKEDYTSYRIADYYLKEEGLDELLKINEKIKEDKKIHSYCYNEDGSLKLEYKDEFEKNIGYKFPIIEYSKILAKNISLFNFVNLGNVKEIVVDHDSPRKEGTNCECYLVCYSPTKYNEDIEKYRKTTSKFYEKIEKTSNGEDSFDDQKHKGLLKELRDRYFRRFTEKFGIRNTPLIEEIESSSKKEIENSKKEYEVLNQVFGLIKPTNVQGEFINPQTQEIIKQETKDNLDDEIHQTYIIKTGFPNTTLDLINDQYKYGIRYFIDKLYSDNKIIQISNPIDEMDYLMSKVELTNNKEERKHIEEKIKNTFRMYKEFNLNYKKIIEHKEYFKIKNDLLEEYEYIINENNIDNIFIEEAKNNSINLKKIDIKNNNIRAILMEEKEKLEELIIKIRDNGHRRGR